VVRGWDAVVDEDQEGGGGRAGPATDEWADWADEAIATATWTSGSGPAATALGSQLLEEGLEKVEGGVARTVESSGVVRAGIPWELLVWAVAGYTFILIQLVSNSIAKVRSGFYILSQALAQGWFRVMAMLSSSRARLLWRAVSVAVRTYVRLPDPASPTLHWGYWSFFTFHRIAFQVEFAAGIRAASIGQPGSLPTMLRPFPIVELLLIFSSLAALAAYLGAWLATALIQYCKPQVSHHVRLMRRSLQSDMIIAMMTAIFPVILETPLENMLSVEEYSTIRLVGFLFGELAFVGPFAVGNAGFGLWRLLWL
jgi:hypothetical protein